MRVAVLGRTRSLLRTGELLTQRGHQIVLVATGRPSVEDPCSVDDFRSAARQWGSAFQETVDLQALREHFARTKPEVGVSVNYPVILPSEITSAPHQGILNAHGGDLPRFRGNACQAWAILQGEDRVALCIHRMVAGEVDSGDVLVRRYFALDEATRVGKIIEWMNTVIPECFGEALAELEADPLFVLEKQPREREVSLRCFPRRPEDGRIDWTAKAIDVVRLVNASGDPYSGAFGMFEGRQVRIEGAEIAGSQPPYLAVPGQVIEIQATRLVVACGVGAVRINEAWFVEDLTPLVSAVTSIRSRLT